MHGPMNIKCIFYVLLTAHLDTSV